MRVCRCFARKYGDVEVEPAGTPWNAWVTNEYGVSSYVTGLWLRYLRHLLQNPQCLHEVALQLGIDPLELRKEIERELASAFQEWKYRVG